MLAGVAILMDRDDREAGRPSEVEAAERVARLVERVRGLEFKRIPRVRTITPEEAREEGLARLDEGYPPRRRAADERVLTLLGLLPRGSDLRELAGRVFGEEVAGFYDDRTKTMTLVAGGAKGLSREITLAHELTHALEDQHFGLDAKGGLDDERAAYAALVEGTATVAMADYATRFLMRGGARRRDLLDRLALTELLGGASRLPPYMQRSLVFPYARGARFVDAIGTWGPANAALRRRPPASTEQILHPAKYRAREAPLVVPRGTRPPQGWHRAARGTVGEFDTGELIRSADSPARAERAAAGWGGGRYELWRRGRSAALVLAWRWDTPRDAAEYAAALPRYVERTLGGRPLGAGLWRSDGRGFVAIGVGPVVRLAIAPSRRLARRLAG